jgi:hypothetical protein
MTRRDTIFNKFEKAGMVTVLVVILLRVLIGPRANFILLVFTTLLSTYYLWFGFFIFNKITPLSLLNKSVTQSLTAFEVYMGIAMGIVVSYALIGILFGFFFYPLMPVILGSALAILVSFNIFIFIYRVFKKKKFSFLESFSFRSLLYSLLLVLLTVPPLETRLNILFKDYPEFIEAYIDARANPADEELQEKVREERSRFR